MNGADLLAQLTEWGSVWLRDGHLEAEAPTPPTEELRALVDENRDALKAAVLLSAPPEWLTKLFDLYWSGHKTLVKRTIPKDTSTQARLDFFGEPEGAPLSYPENLRGGKTVDCLVSVSIKNICAAVAAEVGMPVLEWERIQPEVEDSLGAWKESGAA